MDFVQVPKVFPLKMFFHGRSMEYSLVELQKSFPYLSNFLPNCEQLTG